MTFARSQPTSRAAPCNGACRAIDGSAATAAGSFSGKRAAIGTRRRLAKSVHGSPVMLVQLQRFPLQHFLFTTYMERTWAN